MQDLQDIVTDPELRVALLASLLGIVVGTVFGVIGHEAGHAIAGRLAGYRIRMIRIGRGPELFRIHLGLTLLVWRLFPISGAVAIYRPLTIVRHARLMLIAGGGIANALVACALVALLPLPPDPVAHPILTPVLFFQVGGILNLLFVIGPGRVVTTDGGLFWAALRLPATMPDRKLTRLYASKVTDRYSDLPPAPASALAAVVLHAVLIGTPEATYNHLQGMETAQARLERIRLRDRLLSRSNLTTAERATLLDAQATDALLGGTADLDQINAWSAELIALVPQEPSARTTRAAVLVLMGQQERPAPR